MLRLPKLTLAWTRRTPPAWTPYVAACGLVLFTALVRMITDPLLGNPYPFVTFTVTLVIVAWHVGPLPTTLAALLAIGLSEQIFLQEQAALTSNTELMTLRHITFLASGALCVLLSAARQPARRQSRQATHQLARISTVIGAEKTVRVRLERARRLTEARLSAVVGAAMDAIVLLDGDLNILVFNNAAQSMFELPAERALGASFLQFLPERLRHAYQMRIMTHTGKAAFLTDGMDIAHLVAVRSTGEEFPIEGTIAVIDDHGERLYEIILRDISERMRAEEALREQKERLQLALIAADMGTWRWDLRTGQDTRDGPLNRMLGLTPDESTHDIKDFLARIFPDDLPRVQSLIDQSLETGEVYDAEFRIVQPDGSIRWLRDRGKVILGSDGKAAWMTGVVSDVTVRKLSEQHSARLHAFTAALSGASTSAEVAETFLTHANSLLDNATVVVTGVDRETNALRIVGTGQTGAASPRIDVDVASNFSLLNDALHTRLPAWVEQADETAPIAAMAALPLISHGGVLGGILLLFPTTRGFSEDERDFWLALAHETAVALERAHHFEAEQNARAEAERANNLKLKFLGMISHELRTPLTSIKGFTSTLLASDVAWGSDEQREFIGIINAEADKLRDLVVQLLDVSSLEAGTLRIQPEIVPLHTVVAAAQPQMAAVSASHVLHITLTDDLPPVLVDSLRIGQVIVNLVDNAAKYSPPGSRIHLSAVANGDHVRVAVSDEGEGIPLADRQLVFEAFRQVDRKTRQRGAGLGLAICKGVLEAHGADIWIEDGAAGGAAICFTLPIGVNRSA